MGPAKLCINISQQTWAFVLPPKEDFQTLLRLFTALSLFVNHIYITETLGKELGKEQRTLCKGFIGTNVKPNQENQCLWLILQLLIGDPRECGYLTAQMILTTLCVIWKVTDTMMEHYYDKGLLEWLDCGLAPPRPRIFSLINRVGLNNGPFGNLLQAPEHGRTWDLDWTFHRDQSYSCLEYPMDRGAW